MHPHDNPIYKEKLVFSFCNAYARGQIVKNNDNLDTEYEKLTQKLKRKMIGTFGGSVLCTYLFDKYHLQRLPGGHFRMVGILSGISIGFWFTYRSAFTSEGERMSRAMAFKYENQLHVLFPELKLYFQENPSTNYPRLD